MGVLYLHICVYVRLITTLETEFIIKIHEIEFGIVQIVWELEYSIKLKTRYKLPTFLLSLYSINLPT